MAHKTFFLIIRRHRFLYETSENILFFLFICFQFPSSIILIVKSIPLTHLSFKPSLMIWQCRVPEILLQYLQYFLCILIDLLLFMYFCNKCLVCFTVVSNLKVFPSKLFITQKVWGFYRLFIKIFSPSTCIKFLRALDSSHIECFGISNSAFWPHRSIVPPLIVPINSYNYRN